LAEFGPGLWAAVGRCGTAGRLTPESISGWYSGHRCRACSS
jgi:hypothetical protein